jgi:hypothetical protein
MADATISSLAVQDGVLHIYGANFTQTTTTVYVDDATVTHSFVSASELTVDPAPAEGAMVEVEKAGVQSSPMAVPAADAGGTAVGGETPPAGGSEGNTGPLPQAAEDLLTEQEKGGADPVSAAVEPGPAVVPVGVGPREPYPTGSPAVPPTAGVPMNEAPKP